MDLTIVPVLNKIDLQSAVPDEVAQDIEDLLAIPAEDVLRISAKDSLNIEEVLEEIVTQVPPPQGDAGEKLQALIFDCHYDPYKGVVGLRACRERRHYRPGKPAGNFRQQAH